MLIRVMQMSLFCLIVLSSFFVLFGRPEQTRAAASSTINFQARLLTAAGNVVPDGNYNVEFKLYNAATSTGSSQGSCSGDSACKWVETRTTSDKVRVVNGYMTVNLGSVTAFSNSINWDQEHWLTMNIGGTGSISWDGEMSPRLKLTAVPHALSASQLANTNGANRSTLGWATQTASNSILLPNEAGTLCIQNSANCGFLTSGTGDANYVKLQGSTPGTPQTGSLNISGTGVFGTALQAPLLDTASAGALTIGTTNATSINLQQNTALASGKTLTLQGSVAMQPATDGTSVFNIKSSLANNVFTVDTQNGRVGINLGSNNVPTLFGAGMEIKGAIRLSAGSAQADRYVTPNGSSIDTMINVVNYNPGAFSQIIAMGLPSTAHANSRAVTLLDARTGAHQPTLAVLSPDENQIAGFSWDGSDATFLTKTSSNNMALQANGLNILTLQNVGGAARLGVGNGSPAYALDVTGDINSSTAIRVGGTSVCDTTGGTGCIAKSGSGFYIHNGTSAQAANLHVQAATTGSVAAKFQAFNGGSGDIANFLNGTGTTVGTISSVGAVLFKPSTDSATAFQVQPSGSTTPVLNVDTQNSRVGIGTNAPSRSLHATVNDAQTTAPMALLEQTGAGDITLEFKAPSKSYIVGQDTSDGGKFKISSSTAAANPTLFGKTAIGASEDSSNGNFMNCSKFTTGGSAGTAASFSVYVRGAVDASNNLFQGAIYTDNGSGSNPVNLVASSVSAALAGDSWNTVAISASLSASTIYWLCANTNTSVITSNNWAYDTVAGAGTWKAQTFGTWPANYTTGGGVAGSSTQFSFYVTYAPSGAYDSFAKSLMTLGETGQTTFQNSTNSTAAFQVQNASGVSQLLVDTSNARVYVGPTAGDTTGTLLILGNKTNSGDPTGVAGAMYYNSGTGNFRCYNAGAWQNCVGGLLSSNTAASSAIASCTSACAAFSTSAAIPANYCQPGRVITITASGVYSNAAATTPGLAFGVYYGTDASVRGNNTLIGTASASLVPVTAGLTNAGWRLEFTIICFSATSMNGQGYASIASNATAGSINAVTSMMGTSASTAVTSTTNKNLYIFPTWSASSASNTITLQQLVVTGS